MLNLPSKEKFLNIIFGGLFTSDGSVIALDEYHLTKEKTSSHATRQVN